MTRHAGENPSAPRRFFRRKREPQSTFGKAATSGQSPDANHGYSIEMEDVRDSTSAKLTIAFCASLVTFILVWASLVEVRERVSGAGVIELQGNIERIEHPDGGIVQLLATEKDAVLEPGAVILRFNTDTTEREARALAARIKTLEDEHARVAFLMQMEASSPPRARIAGDAASEAFWSEQEFLAAQLDVMDAEENRLVTQIQSLNERSQLIREEQKIVSAQLERYRLAMNSGAVRLQDKERLEREAIQLSSLLAESTGRAADLAVAKEQINRRKSELLAQSRRDAAVRLTKVEDELVSLTQAAADAQARIDRATVRTVAGGKVQRLDVLRANEVVAPGDVIAEVVPADSAYQAVVNVSADRIGFIRPGMDVSLKISSYDFTRYGDIPATVTEVSPTSFMNEEGQIVYRVTIDLPDTQPDAAGQIDLRPGMTVTADILTGVRSILSYLLQPVKRIQSEAMTES